METSELKDRAKEFTQCEYNISITNLIIHTTSLCYILSGIAPVLFMKWTIAQPETTKSCSEIVRTNLIVQGDITSYNPTSFDNILMLFPPLNW